MWKLILNNGPMIYTARYKPPAFSQAVMTSLKSQTECKESAVSVHMNIEENSFTKTQCVWFIAESLFTV